MVFKKRMLGEGYHRSGNIPEGNSFRQEKNSRTGPRARGVDSRIYMPDHNPRREYFSDSCIPQDIKCSSRHPLCRYPPDKPCRSAFPVYHFPGPRTADPCPGNRPDHPGEHPGGPLPWPADHMFLAGLHSPT